MHAKGINIRNRHSSSRLIAAAAVAASLVMILAVVFCFLHRLHPECGSVNVQFPSSSPDSRLAPFRGYGLATLVMSYGIPCGVKRLIGKSTCRIGM